MPAAPHVEALRHDGYTIVRGVYTPREVGEIAGEMDRLKSVALGYHANFRDGNVVYVVRPDPQHGRHVRFIDWPSYLSPLLDRYRTHPKQLSLLEPLLGGDIKQITNKISWKTPRSADTAYGFHQDAPFRRPANAFRNLASAYVQTLVAIDPHTDANGCLQILPGSHHRGLVGLTGRQSIMAMEWGAAVLEEAGLDPDRLVSIRLEPGDVALWTPYTVHGSGPNRSDTDRRAVINGYVRARDSDRGAWAFRDRRPCAVEKGVLIQYEQLLTRPEPHYIEGPLYPAADYQPPEDADGPGGGRRTAG